MAVSAECDQVAHHIATQPASRFHVMDVNILHRTALLTPPTISFKLSHRGQITTLLRLLGEKPRARIYWCTTKNPPKIGMAR
jgi:hypothetical protein